MAQKIGIKIVDVGMNNVNQYPPSCFLHKASDGFKKKYFWLKKRFGRGLKIKQLYHENSNNCIGFIEYVPGEYAWRAVDAKDYMFIHCIWIYSNKNKEKGYASILLQECIDDAKQLKKKGVAVITGDGAFIAGKELFLKNGFKPVASIENKVSGKKQIFDLLTLSFDRKSRAPKFRDWEGKLEKYQGLNIIYANQCPWTARGIKGLIDTAVENGFKPKVIELKNARQAQNAPSVYATFNLVYDGKLLADHYISNHRFRNILANEIKK